MVGYRAEFAAAVADNTAEAFCRFRMELLSGAMAPRADAAADEPVLSPFWIQMANTYSSLDLILKWWLPSRSGDPAEAASALVAAIRDLILSMSGQFYGSYGKTAASVVVLPLQTFRAGFLALHDRQQFVYDLASRFANYDPRTSDVSMYDAVRSLVIQSVMIELGIREPIPPNRRAFGNEMRRILSFATDDPERQRLEACLDGMLHEESIVLRGLYSEGGGWKRLADNPRYKTHLYQQRDLAAARTALVKCLPNFAEFLAPEGR